MLNKHLFKNFSSLISKELSFNNKVLSLSINSLQNNNALSKKLILDLENDIHELNNNESYLKNLRVVILKSSHPKIFCAGADLKERKTMNENDVRNFVSKLRSTFYNFSKINYPTICSIDGFALGGGLELALSCDIRIATNKSYLGLTETSLGIIPGAGGTQSLQRIIGISKAKELIYRAKRLSGRESLEYGLVNYATDNIDQSNSIIYQIIEDIVDKTAPLALSAAKSAIDEGNGLTLEEALKIEESKYEITLKSKDRIEGLDAFINKRKPEYKGY